MRGLPGRADASRESADAKCKPLATIAVCMEVGKSLGAVSASQRPDRYLPSRHAQSVVERSRERLRGGTCSLRTSVQLRDDRPHDHAKGGKVQIHAAATARGLCSVANDWAGFCAIITKRRRDDRMSDKFLGPTGCPMGHQKWSTNWKRLLSPLHARPNV